MADGKQARAAGGLPAFRKHYQYAPAVGEVHSRPFPEYPSSRVVIHYAFMSEGGVSVSQAVLAELCRTRGEAVPNPEMRYHEIPWGKGALRWESHSEFSSFTFDAPAPRSFRGAIANHPFGNGFEAPGALISATRVEIRPLTAANRKLLAGFDQDSLCVSLLSDGKSLLATDFRQDINGQTAFLLLEAGLGESRIGYHAKSAIEVDTYRTLAMLGLPLARSISSKLREMEVDLSRLTSAMRSASAERAESILSEITSLATELESDAAASLYRFGASRAYGGIVADRLNDVGNEAAPGYMSIGAYLNRSLLPALRTCASVEDRQANLSRKLSRVANLLRTHVEIEIENQNRNLLDSMNRRTQLQLRLQQTVEGLSVAAVSYYVVGLFYYLAQAFEKSLPTGITAKMATGFFVPVAIALIWGTVRRIRRKHSEGGH